MKKFLMVISLMVLGVGCGSGDPIVPKVSCNSVSCPEADDVSRYTSGNDRNITCVWHCVNYEGQDGVYVSLSYWAWDGGCYQLEDEFVSDGICF